MNNLTKQINSLFILGYKGEQPHKELETLIEQELGGVIFFADNILDRDNFKSTISKIKNIQPQIILSIDQEGGRVQRTNNLHDSIKYLSPLNLCNKDIKLIEKQYKVLSNELLDFGINMDFAPVLDIFVKPNDPIINERAFGKNLSDVAKYAKIQNDELQKKGIKTVGKHFPGHGGASVDSHIDMPCIELSKEELKNHIAPFEKIKTDAVMVAHVHYPAFDNEKIPASLSKNVINYLKKEVKFDGLIISDDMVMGGITKHFDPLEACTRGILAGIDMFIFREHNADTEKLLKDLKEEALNNKELREKIESKYRKVTAFKKEITLSHQDNFEVATSIRELESIKNSPNIR